MEYLNLRKLSQKRNVIKQLVFLNFILSLLFIISCNSPSQKIWLDELDLSKIEAAAGGAVANKSMWNTPIIIAADTFQRGVGTHASGMISIALDGNAKRFHALVGLDDSPPELERLQASAEFVVYADNKEVYRSGVMKNGDKAKKIELSLKGVKSLKLYADHADDGISGDRVDYADAWIEYANEKPAIADKPLVAEYIQTPTVPETPVINAPFIHGARPGNPVLFTIPVTGVRPIRVTADQLPEGLKIDSKTGRIYGIAKKAGTYKLNVKAENAIGSDSKELTLVIGDKLLLTPPMGWNSWNVFGSGISQEKVISAADAMITFGLNNFGYTYINIDDGWQGTRGGKYNAILPNEKFPDMKGMIDYIHSLGLKVGIYSSPWVWTYAGYTGGAADTKDGLIFKKEKRYGEFNFHEEDVIQWVEWGFDYLKYDWNPNDIEHTTLMSETLKKSGRDIAFSISNAAPYELAGEWARLTNVWRTTGDIHDSWYSLTSIGFIQDKWQPFGGPGHWNDPDMLVVGKVGWGGNIRKTRLTADEQYTHISLWSILAAPLLIGCDLSLLDEFTVKLLTNSEVIAVDQDVAGIQGNRVKLDKQQQIEIWSRPLADGSLAVGLFNLSDSEQTIEVTWNELGISGNRKVRNLWRQADIGSFSDAFSSIVPSHGVAFIKISKNS
jgi:alpha-galactosidase